MIEEKLYKKILDSIPICCVDIILFHKGKVLLAKRVNEPAKGEWWIPGGRVLKNEKLVDAAKRKAVEELGTEIIIKNLIGTYEITFVKGPFEGIKDGIHDISVNFLVELKDKNSRINLDKTNKEYKWIDKIDSDLHDYVKEVLIDSKVFKKTELINKERYNVGAIQ